MSRIPFLSNELSPWPRVHLSAVPEEATAVKQWTAFPRVRRGSSQQSGNTLTSTKLRGRASSDATPSQARGRSTSFESALEYENVYDSGSVQRLDRNFSDRRVQELLELRKQKLREAESKGDEFEVFRLKNMNLFDNIARSTPERNEPKEAELSRDFTEQTDHHGLTAPAKVLDFGFITRPKSVSHGHTATLCSQLKLQHAQGLTVPEEFFQCVIHPTPSPCLSSNPSFTIQPTSPSSLSSRSKSSLRHTQVASIGSSSLRNSFELSSSATGLSTAITSVPSSTENGSPATPNLDEEDPFLYIAKNSQRHAKGDRRLKEAKPSHPQASNSDARHSIHIQCTCANHICRTNLSGPPSKHCRFCKVPRLPNDILAAVDRIEEMKTSLFAQADTNLRAEDPCEADEVQKFEALQEDMKLAEIYSAETEKRCRNGVWWEGWLIAQDLKRRGIVGSKKPFVCEIDKAVVA